MALTVEAAWLTLQTVLDPEVPALSVVDLGIIRDVKISAEGQLKVTVTPTYSGCPATKLISDQIIEALNKAGANGVEVETVYAPAWTTDWISEVGKKKLKAYGIAPPGEREAFELVPFPKSKKPLPCPFCDSANTRKESEFGSTACKALYFCDNCHQPFEYFKPH